MVDSDKLLLPPPKREVSLELPAITKRKPEPWKHQRQGYHLAREHEGFLLGHQMGCGKSRTAIDILQNDEPGPILVLSPKAVVATWPHEVAKHAVDPWPVLALRDGSTGARAEAARDWLKRHRGKRSMLVANYDVAYRPVIQSALKDVRWSAVVCDESHKIKSPNGKASKAAALLGSRAARRLALTGTPIPHSPFDLWAQFRFIDPRVFGSSFVAFRARYALCHREFPSKVLRWLNLDELSDRFYSRAHRVLSEDVLDLPEKIVTQVPVTLCAKARRAYDELEEDLVTQVGTGEISVSNAMVKLLRLQQITGGSVPVEDETVGKYHCLIDDGKDDACSEIIEGLGDETVVVFCRFTAELDRVERIAQRHGAMHGELSGRRNDLAGNQLPDWSGRKGVFGVQIQAGGAGVDLTRSSACVYWSVGFSLGEYEQSMARLHRPGQTRTCRYWQLVAEDTVDEQVYRALAARADVAEAVLGGMIAGR